MRSWTSGHYQIYLWPVLSLKLGNNYLLYLYGDLWTPFLNLELPILWTSLVGWGMLLESELSEPLFGLHHKYRTIRSMNRAEPYTKHSFLSIKHMIISLPRWQSRVNLVMSTVNRAKLYTNLRKTFLMWQVFPTL